MSRKTLTFGLLAFALILAVPSATVAQLGLGDAGSKDVKISGDFTFLSEAPVETIEGTAAGASGTINTDTSDLSKTSGTITVPVASMKTGNKKRDKHLNSKAWLDSKNFPEIEFVISSVKVGEVDSSSDTKTAELEATGDFSMHGVTKEMTIPLTLKWKGSAVKVTANFDVALADFDVKGAKGVVGNKVGTSIQLTANLTGSAE